MSTFRLEVSPHLSPILCTPKQAEDLSRNLINRLSQGDHIVAAALWTAAHECGRRWDNNQCAKKYRESESWREMMQKILTLAEGVRGVGGLDEEFPRDLLQKTVSNTIEDVFSFWDNRPDEWKIKT